MPPVLPDMQHVDWTRSYHGLGSEAFTPEQQTILTAPIDLDDVEVKPDGILYLPEIKYRRILNKTFGAGGWGLAPRGESIVTERVVTREYALVAQGRYVRADCISPESYSNAKFTDWFRLPAASSSILIRKVYRQPRKAASLML